MKNYYECHVTMEGNPLEIGPFVKKLGWKFSAIDGDPVLGRGIKCYATNLYSKQKTEEEVVALLKSTAARIMEVGITVLRRKVELVIYDDRSSAVVCDGSCCGVS